MLSKYDRIVAYLFIQVAFWKHQHAKIFFLSQHLVKKLNNNTDAR